MRPIFVLPLLLASLTIANCSSQTTTSEPSTSPETAAATETAAPDAAVTEAPNEAATPTSAASDSSVSETLPAVYSEDDVAIAGADPIAYFTEGAYVPGSAEFAYEWSEATWHFASAENRDEFASNPRNMLPNMADFVPGQSARATPPPSIPKPGKLSTASYISTTTKKFRTAGHKTSLATSPKRIAIGPQLPSSKKLGGAE